VSVAAATAVVAVSWALTRTKHRDRRRVLGALGFYAIASVAMSAVSGAVPHNPSATATYVDSGEALARRRVPDGRRTRCRAGAGASGLVGSPPNRRTADSEAPEVSHAGAQGRARG